MNQFDPTRGRPAAAGQPDPARPVHVDRRFRALPFGREAPARSAGRRRPVDVLTSNAVRPAARLHAGRAQGHRLRPAAPPAALCASTRRSPTACAPSATAPRWSCCGPGSRRWRPSSPASRSGPALSARPASACSTTCAGARRKLRAHDRPLRRAGVAARRPAAGRLAAAGARGAGRRGRGMAGPPRPDTTERPVVALAPGAVGPGKRWPAQLLRRAGAAARRARAPPSGCSAARTKPRSPPRSSPRPARKCTRPHRERSAQCHPRAHGGATPRSPTIPA